TPAVPLPLLKRRDSVTGFALTTSSGRGEMKLAPRASRAGSHPDTGPGSRAPGVSRGVFIMIRWLTSALLGLCLLCGNAPDQKDAAQKDAVKKDAPKVEAKGQTVKVKSVDEKTNTLVVTTPEGKTLTFKVDKDVEIVGPRGGKSEERLKD